MENVTATPAGLDDPFNLGPGEELENKQTFQGGPADYSLFNANGRYCMFLFFLAEESSS